MSMHPYPRFVRAVFSALSLICVAHAELSTVFNDTFGSGSTINSTATPPGTRPSLSATDYQQITAKALPAGTPSVTGGLLRFGVPATTSAVNMIEALFTKYPITLGNTGDTIEVTVTFTPTAAMLDFSASGLFIGLYNGNQIQPKPGGLINSTVGSAGNAQNWTGYASRIMSSGTGQIIVTRPAQTAAAANNQDVVYSYASGVTIGSSTPSTLSPLVGGTTYTVILTITKTGASTLDITSRLFEGTNLTLAPLVTKTVSSASIPTGTFDALSFGFRATGTNGPPSTTHIENVDVSNIKVTTTASTTIVPVITTDPFSQTKSVGESVSLAVVASGGGAPLSYQWYKNNSLIDGATAATYEILSATLDHAGDYKVTVTDVAGSATSAVATLTVTAGSVAPSLLVNPDNASLLVGGSNTFVAQASGTATLTYQWQFSSDAGANYDDIPGATDQNYTLSNAQLVNTGLYRLVVTNGLGTATSTAATLTVNQVPSITVPPVGVTIAAGASLDLSVTALGTPAPTYLWKRNGVTIPGATSATYSVGSATGANTGNHTVTVTNSVGAATSSIASVAVLAAGFTTTSTTPSVGAASILPDTRLSITFNQPVTAGVSGFIKIYDASNDALVDTVDLVAATTLKNVLRAGSTLSTRDLPVQNKSIGTLTNFNYYPIIVSGNTATIYPRNGVLAYNKSYYITIDAGVFVDATGGTFAGMADTSTWTFSTRASGPAPGTPTLTVAADGSGDFYTVQGALDSLPPGNTAATTLFIRTGTYFETVYFSAKNNITFLGESRPGTIIEYPNNNNLNNVSGVYHRMTFYGSSVSGITLANLTVLNSTPQGGSQAEAIIIGGNATTGHNIITQVDAYSYQDTVQFNGQIYLSDCRIEGDVDFMWGNGPAFFQNCDIKMLRASGGYFAQIRNSAANHGFVYVDCRLTSIPGSTGNFLNRIDPSAFPFCEVVFINCSMGSFITPAGWKFDNATTGPTVKLWEYNSTDSVTGLPIDVSGRLPTYSKQLTQPTDATDIANYSTPSFVLGGSWTPALAPIITAHPQGVNRDPGQSLTLQVTALAIPAATYQWYKGVDPIGGATSATYSVGSVTAGNAGTYSVVVTNTNGFATSTSATVTVTPPTPVESWRETYFGTTANTGSAADTADPDGDGVTNLMEFAIGTTPTSNTSGGGPLQYSGTLAGGGTVVAPGLPVTLIETIVTGADMRAVYSRRNDYAAAGLTITPQFSNDLVTWEPSPAPPVILADDGTAQIVSVTYTRILSNGKKAAFFRLNVSRN